nr:hypothetical protein [Cytophagales bacterium]
MKRLLLPLTILYLIPSAAAFAAVTVVQGLSFGSFISTRNDAQYDIIVNTDASYSFSPGGFFMISPPNPGVYDISGLDPSTAIISVTVTQIAPLTAPGNSLQMINFTSTNPPATSAGGVARIEIGATARTTGTGIAYPDNTYNGVVEITVNF